jgi:hypothetical protein
MLGEGGKAVKRLVPTRAAGYLQLLDCTLQSHLRAIVESFSRQGVV